ncbi:hypothetical protein DFH07DRAFT_986073 [Mycena maculata]|uniref:Uncharacterized protein n=1 Tax=Mycena maculata TaxID=230809 RepID=A0AAD7MYM4_9AGAR|nr:hypothetical protein DFH07DRAFT_986073 [Mycena maculata]
MAACPAKKFMENHFKKGGKLAINLEIDTPAFGNWEKELAKECKQRTSATAKQPIDIRLVYDYAELDRTDDGGTITVFEDNVTIHVGEQADAWDPMTLLSSKVLPVLPGRLVELTQNSSAMVTNHRPTTVSMSARMAARAYCLLSDAGVKPQLMLNTLEQTGAVMSSSTVGLVVTDLTFTPNDLDVYGTSAQEIVLLTILCDMEFHIDYRITETPTLHYSHKRESVVSLRTAGENGVSGGGADKSQRSGLVQQWNNNRQILYSGVPNWTRSQTLFS